MIQEFETHLLNIDRAALVAKLESLGAKKTKDVLMRRVTFDFPDRRLDAERAFIRVRDNGAGKIELAFKRNARSGETGVMASDEIEFEISDMGIAQKFFEAIGIEAKQFIETKRLSYELGDLHFDIDEWPMLPPFLEIEGPNKHRVLEGVRLLGYAEADTFQGDAGNMYDQAGIDWKSMKRIVF